MSDDSNRPIRLASSAKFCLNSRGKFCSMALKRSSRAADEGLEPPAPAALRDAIASSRRCSTAESRLVTALDRSPCSRRCSTAARRPVRALLRSRSAAAAAALGLAATLGAVAAAATLALAAHRSSASTRGSSSPKRGSRAPRRGSRALRRGSRAATSGLSAAASLACARRCSMAAMRAVIALASSPSPDLGERSSSATRATTDCTSAAWRSWSTSRCAASNASARSVATCSPTRSASRTARSSAARAACSSACLSRSNATSFRPSSSRRPSMPSRRTSNDDFSAARNSRSFSRTACSVRCAASTPSLCSACSAAEQSPRAAPPSRLWRSRALTRCWMAVCSDAWRPSSCRTSLSCRCASESWLLVGAAKSPVWADSSGSSPVHMDFTPAMATSAAPMRFSCRSTCAAKAPVWPICADSMADSVCTRLMSARSSAIWYSASARTSSNLARVEISRASAASDRLRSSRSSLSHRRTLDSSRLRSLEYAFTES
mmetsp:Transcript_55242/g.147936  ORF Transcript_55242/g.147936 Transcript_55242/m.147936 type:complete len:491 (-) Transcript_55242:161-1633(-)